MPYSKETIRKMHSLKKLGHSVPEISRELSVPKTTVLRHVRQIEILPEHYQRWLDRKRSSSLLKERNTTIARKEVSGWISSISNKEAAIVAAMLYWAEGSKKEFTLSNTDSNLIRTFLTALRKVFNIPLSDIKISLRIYEDLDQKACLEHWSEVTGIKLDNSTKINVLIGSKKGKLKYGMCRIRVRKSGMLHKKLFAIIELVNKYICPHSLMDKTRDS